MKRIIALSALIYFSIGTSHSEGTYKILGAGTSSCGKWIEDRKDPTKWYQEAQWVHGFYSGLTGYSGAIYREVDSPSILAYLDKYCAENPLDRIGRAAEHLMIELIITGE